MENFIINLHDLKEKNNYIKKIIYNDNGFNNFERERNKFICLQNQYEAYKISELRKRNKEKTEFTKKNIKKVINKSPT